MKPLIGIVSRIEYPGDTDKLVINDEYRRVVIRYGGNPFLILPSQDINYGKTKNSDVPELSSQEKEMLISQLSLCNGIILPGGFKMTNLDLFTLDYAIKNDIPILGICLGMQIMANYGRDVWNEKNDPDGINHYDNSGDLVHAVRVNKNSKLYSIIGEEEFKVNSFHNMHVLPSNFYNNICYSEDNLIEGIEYPLNTFNIGVQWHPERMYEFDERSQRLFKSFIEVSSKHDKTLNFYIHE